MMNYDLILFGGQSNMEGQTEVLLSADPIRGAYEYRFFGDRLKPLCNPCGEDIRFDGTEGYAYSGAVSGVWHKDNALGSTCDGNTSLLPAFCRAYMQNTDMTDTAVVAVHVAKGATDMLYWLPETDGYRILVQKSKAAIDKCGRDNIRRIAFVWLQGESDALASRKKDEYKAYLSAFEKALKHDLDIEIFGVIRVGRFTMDARDDEILAAQDEICAESPRFTMLTTRAADFCTDPAYKEMMNPFEFGHYSARGLETLGAEAGGALAAYYQRV